MGEDLELIPSSRSLPWRLDSHLAGPRERRGGLGKELETFHGFAARGEHRLRAFKLIALILRERNFSELVPSITQQDEGTIQDTRQLRPLEGRRVYQPGFPSARKCGCPQCYMRRIWVPFFLPSPIPSKAQPPSDTPRVTHALHSGPKYAYVPGGCHQVIF